MNVCSKNLFDLLLTSASALFFSTMLRPAGEALVTGRKIGSDICSASDLKPCRAFGARNAASSSKPAY
jgi:hypothetical protein